MRIARFTTGGDPAYAFVEGDPGEEELVVLTGDPLFLPGAPTGERIPLAREDVRLLTPVIPRSKAVCAGRNYADHAAELGTLAESELPLLFLKPNTAVIGPDDPIVLPDYSSQVQLEAELAIVIGRVTKDVSPEAASAAVAGYTCANDVTARDLQRQENQWFRAKAFDTSLPLGPWIETELDTSDLAISSRVNGETRQKATTADMLWDVPTLVSMVSSVLTLLPGDVILTGTPAGISDILHGDRVEVEIEGIGTLMNPVVRR
ncbi:MAG: fumarylacetoacetate hydrolase family protein [Demequinaceae bacterium]|nr:fumarylacetoacetate hydrolase family protein [Demequinaceae bacterium]